LWPWRISIIIKLMDPVTSVIISSHNGARTIRQAIDSALEQKDVPGDFEVIVVDDASTDHTAEILRSYGRTLTSIVQPTNCGVSATLNHGVRESRGKYVAFLHDDDYFRPDKLREAVFALNQVDAVLAFSDYIIIDSETDASIEVVKFDHAPELEEMFVKWECIGPPSSVTVRKEFFNACGGFDERLRWCEDINLWLRLRAQGSFVHVPRELTVYRKRSSIRVIDKRYPLEQLLMFERIMREHFGRRAEGLIAHARDQRAAMLLGVALHEIDQGRPADAIRTLYELICYRPSYPLRSVPLRRLVQRHNLSRLARILRIS